MPAEYIRNPKTGKQIKIGGPTYNKLLAEGINFAFPVAQPPNQYVKNPKTGKQIKVGGPTYNKLKKEGHFTSPKGKTSPLKGKTSPPKGKTSPPKGKGKGKRKSPAKRGGFTVAQLKKMLKEKGLPTTGTKAVLMARYQKALQTPIPQPSPVRSKTRSPSPSPKTPKRKTPSKTPKRKTPSKTPKRKTPSPKVDNECTVCFNSDGDRIKCKQCKNGLCLDCYKGVIGANAKCPICRAPFTDEEIKSRVSPRSLARQMEKQREFKKAIEAERTQWDAEIARQLQERLNNGGKTPPAQPTRKIVIGAKPTGHIAKHLSTTNKKQVKKQVKK